MGGMALLQSARKRHAGRVQCYVSDADTIVKEDKESGIDRKISAT